MDGSGSRAWEEVVREAGARGRRRVAKTQGNISISSSRLGFLFPSRPEGDLLSGINLKINKLVCVRGYGFTVPHWGCAKWSPEWHQGPAWKTAHFIRAPGPQETRDPVILDGMGIQSSLQIVLPNFNGERSASGKKKRRGCWVRRGLGENICVAWCIRTGKDGWVAALRRLASQPNGGDGCRRARQEGRRRWIKWSSDVSDGTTRRIKKNAPGWESAYPNPGNNVGKHKTVAHFGKKFLFLLLRWHKKKIEWIDFLFKLISL